MGDRDAVVRLEKVSRSFKSLFGRRAVRAVDGLSLEVRPGEIFGLLGPNGSGKTTTLQMVLGLLPPTGGRIEVFGLPPGSSTSKRRIGYLPEEFEANSFLSGEETLIFYGSFFGLRRAEVRRRSDELLAALGLWEDRKRRLRDYSKGMRRRIGLAQSLLHDPELLVLDEPTNGLDPLGIGTVKAILRDLRRRGRSIVVSSHILPEMEDLCDRVAILDRGRSLVQGSLGDLLERSGRHLIEVEGEPPRQEDLTALFSAKGITVAGVRPSRSTLEELFLRILEEASGKPPGQGNRG